MNLNGITRVLAIKGLYAAAMEAGDKQIDIWLGRDHSEFRCARCGQMHLVAHDEHEVTVRDLPMTGRPVYLHLMKARIRCCGRQPELIAPSMG